MFVRVLLPEKHLIRKRGGPDEEGNFWTKRSFEFWMSPGRAGDQYDRVGKNGLPPTLETASGEEHLKFLKQGSPESEHHSKWRIEIEPTEERKDNLFLVVLYVCDKDVKEMPKTELLRHDGMVGTRIAGKDQIWEVLFPVEDGRGEKISITEKGVEQPTVVEETLAVRPERVVFGQNYPNPFNPETTVPFALASRTTVTLRISSTTGQVIRTLLDQSMPAGRYRVVWDGKDHRGNNMPSGVYIARLTVDSHQTARTIRMVLVR
jgi:hypothetical protein